MERSRSSGSTCTGSHGDQLIPLPAESSSHHSRLLTEFKYSKRGIYMRTFERSKPMSSPPWPTIVSLISSAGAVYTLRLMWTYRDRPGARYWGGFITAIMIWTFSYGVALLVSDPVTRELLEAPIYFGKNFCAPMILGFALAYTGRKEYAYSRLMKGNLLYCLVASFIYATNPIHGLCGPDIKSAPSWVSRR